VSLKVIDGGFSRCHLAVVAAGVLLIATAYQRFKAGEFGQALGIAERLYGPNHPAVAVELRFVVQVLQAVGRSAEAEPLMRRARAIDEKNLSPDDPSIAFDVKILTGLLGCELEE
jgi:hypothetical protein